MRPGARRRWSPAPNAQDLSDRLSPEVVDLIVRVRKELTDAGLDAGPETSAWHLEDHQGYQVSRSAISCHLTAARLITPEPKKRPKSSYVCSEATMSNETWQSDFTRYRLTHRQPPRRGRRDHLADLIEPSLTMHLKATTRVPVLAASRPDQVRGRRESRKRAAAR
jgi:hypothetical protein